MVGIMERFYDSAILETLTRPSISVDFDTCAEADLVDRAFAEKYSLQTAPFSAPTLALPGGTQIPPSRVVHVPLTMTDSRGAKRTFSRPCTVVEKKGGSPVLLSMTALTQQSIHIEPATRKWWFNIQIHQLSILTPRKFIKACKNQACVYAVIKAPEELYLPDEDDGGDPSPLPKEFADFQDCLSTAQTVLLPSKGSPEHTIDLLPGTAPPYGPIYPLSQRELAALRQYIEENMAAGRIRKSVSPAGAPILFVPKANGELRLCVDYRGLNKITVKNRHPLPLISEILDRLSGAKYFSNLDIKEAYYRVRIREGDEWKTAFRTRYGHYEYLVMPFGLTNAPATFQSHIHHVLHGYLDLFCIVYLDDILVFSFDRESHTEHVRKVLERLRKAQLFINSAKCVFYQSQVEFLGFIVGQEGISMDPERVQVIAEWPIPQTFRDIQVFLGFCNFYRRFIHGYSRLTAPLTELLKGSRNGRKPGSVTLNEVEVQAFQDLVDAFQRAPVLRHFDPHRHILVETDASDVAQAAILSQPDDQGIYHPVAFWSAKFKGPEVRYSTPDKELFAIVSAFKQWRHYLEGSLTPVEVLTDHQNLRSFMALPRLNGRQARWCMFLAPFDFEIRYRSGKRNPADAPSRRPDYGGNSDLEDGYLPTLKAKVARSSALGIPTINDFQFDTAFQEGLRGAQGSGEARGNHSPVGDSERPNAFVMAALVPRQVARHCVSQLSDSSENIDAFMILITRLQQLDTEVQSRIINVKSGDTQNGLWSIDGQGMLRYKDRIWIPAEASVKSEILQRFHDDPLAGHFGVNRTEELIQRRFHWKNMRQEIQEYVRSCATCQGVVSKRHKPYGQLESLPRPARPWLEISMDFITGLPEARFDLHSVDSILVIVDRYTRMAKFFPVATTINAAELARLFHREIELKFGAPKGIVSDRGPIFTSEFWGQLAQITGTKLRLSSTFHPQSDGQTERMNQVYLRCFTDEERRNWPQLLASAEFCINNAVNVSTGVSPFRALMGYDPELYARIEGDAIQVGVPAVNERLEKLSNLRARLEQHAKRASESQAKYYNQQHTPRQYKRGDLVMLSTRNLKFQFPKKLAPKFVGPFRVLDVIGSQAYRLALPEKYERIHNVFHVSLLEPWNPRSSDNSEDLLPMPDLEDEPDEWEVEDIVGDKRHKEQAYFLSNGKVGLPSTTSGFWRRI